MRRQRNRVGQGSRLLLEKSPSGALRVGLLVRSASPPLHIIKNALGVWRELVSAKFAQILAQRDAGKQLYRQRLHDDLGRRRVRRQYRYAKHTDRCRGGPQPRPSGKAMAAERARVAQAEHEHRQCCACPKKH